MRGCIFILHCLNYLITIRFNCLGQLEFALLPNFSLKSIHELIALVVMLRHNTQIKVMQQKVQGPHSASFWRHGNFGWADEWRNPYDRPDPLAIVEQFQLRRTGISPSKEDLHTILLQMDNLTTHYTNDSTQSNKSSLILRVMPRPTTPSQHSMQRGLKMIDWLTSIKCWILVK